MNPHSIERAKSELIQALRGRADHFLGVAEALSGAEAPWDLLSALHTLGEIDVGSEVSDLSGKLGVLALLAQAERPRKQAHPGGWTDTLPREAPQPC
jgi:hypothetical protein